MRDVQEISNRRLFTVLSLVVLAALLLLRFPFLILLAYKLIPISSRAGFDIFLDGTYILTAILIFLQRDVLADHHIGLIALIVFMLAPVFKAAADLLFRFESAPIAWIQVFTSASLFIVLLIYPPKLRKRKPKEVLLWLMIAVAAGIGIGLLSGYLISFQNGRSPQHPTLTYFIVSFISQLGNAAVSEEPLFRGFLWGFLKKAHWKDSWIWLFQAALFMLGHIYYAGVANYSFLLIVPIGGFVLGLIAWRSRSIGASMITHGLTNTIGDMVAHLTW